MFHSGTFRVGLRFLHARRIDVHSDAAGAEFLRRSDDNPAVAASQVVQNVLRTDFGKHQHPVTTSGGVATNGAPGGTWAQRDTRAAGARRTHRSHFSHAPEESDPGSDPGRPLARVDSRY